MKSTRPRNNRWLVVFGALGFIFSVFGGTVLGANHEENGADLSIRGNGTDPLSLTLVWYDNRRLLPGSFERMAEEVARIYEEVGVDVTWEIGSEGYIDGVNLDPLRIDVVLIPSHPSSWGLKEDAMGLATFREGAKGSVYVFFPALIRTLGLSTDAGDLYHPRARKMVSRAMARIVSHELLHVMAPHYPHTDGGLMNGNMSKKYLERPMVHLDEVSARVLRGAVFAKTQQSVVASRERRVGDKAVVVEGSSPQEQNK